MTKKNFYYKVPMFTAAVGSLISITLWMNALNSNSNIKNFIHMQIHVSNQSFPGFDQPASNLSAFLFCLDTFIISLRGGSIVKFSTNNVSEFKQWLIEHKVREVATEYRR